MIISTIIALVVALAGSAQDSPAAAAPNQRFRRNAELNASYDADGSTLDWVFSGDGGSISASPLVDSSRVYIATNGHHVFALDLETGRQLWAFHADEQVMTQPLVSADKLIVGIGNAQVVGYRPGQYVGLGTSNNEIVAISATDGNPVWSIGLPGTGMPTGIIVSGTFYHVDGAGELFALDAINGTYRYRQSVESTSFMSAINYADGLFVTAGNWPNRVYAFKAGGAIAWRHEFPRRLSGFSDCPLAISHGVAIGDYVESADATAITEDLKPGIEHVYALRLSDGALLWDVKAEAGIVPPYNMASIPVISGRTVVVGSALSGVVHGIDIFTGTIRWSIKTAGPVKNGSVIVDGVAYFGDLAGNLWAVAVSDGSVIGHRHFPDQFNVGSPVSLRHSLVIGSASGKVYALPLASIREARDDTTAADDNNVKRSEAWRGQ